MGRVQMWRGDGAEGSGQLRGVGIYRGIEARVESPRPERYRRCVLWILRGFSRLSQMRLAASRERMPERLRASVTAAAFPRWVAAAMSLSSCAMGSPAVELL